MVPPWGRFGGAGDSGLDGTVPAGLEMVPGQENPEGVAGSGDAPARGAQGVARGGQMWRKGKVGAERTSKGGGDLRRSGGCWWQTKPKMVWLLLGDLAWFSRKLNGPHIGADSF